MERADLCHALQLGSRPHFYLDEFPREMVESLVQHNDLRDVISLAVNRINPISADQQSIMWDITSVSYILQRRLAKFDPLDFQEMHLPILYRLLNLNPPWNSSLETIPDASQVYCLSLLAFASTMLFNIRRHKKLPYELIASKLRHALLYMSETASLETTALLWALFIGGISVFQDDDLMVLMPCIRMTASSLGITDWEGAKAHLGQYPWIGAFHDEPGQRLWIQMIES
jgi:Fungal specific transcription factor domain